MCVLYIWVLKGFRLHSAEFVCLLLSTVYIVFPVSVNVHVIFVCLCLQASQQGFFCCSPADWTDRVGFSYHSNCYMLRLPLCLHPKNITHPHTHTQAHTNAKQTKTLFVQALLLYLVKVILLFSSSSFNCLILSCDRVCRPPVFRANKRGCFSLCCSSTLLLFFFGLCSGVVKIRCPLPLLSCGDMCS